MPHLSWPSKKESSLPCGDLVTDLIHYPPGGRWEDPALGSRLVLGDNMRVMGALSAEYADKIDLIYADPPFFTNKGYAARVGRGEDSRKPEEWALADGYPDEWDDLDDYLDMLYPRLQAMHQLLSPTGSLFLHLDWHADSYARILLDEIFGYDNLRNEIIWTYHGPSPIRSAFNRKHDVILFYSKSDHYKFNVDSVRVPYAKNTIETFKSSKKAGFGKMPDLERGKVPEDWWYFPVVARLHQERTGYPTQKPESLLERIILSATDPGDLVADFFGGAGTTGSAAARLGRRFILADLQPRSIHTTRARLILDQGAWNEENLVPVLVQHEGSLESKPAQTFTEAGFEAPVIRDRKVELSPSLTAEVLYWEIDPDWDGNLFRSRIQAARPWRDGDLLAALPLPNHTGNVCVRAVLTSEGQFQQVIQSS